MSDASLRKRMARGDAAAKKLRAAEVRYMKTLLATGLFGVAWLGRQFGVTPGLIRYIRDGVVWTDTGAYV